MATDLMQATEALGGLERGLSDTVKDVYRRGGETGLRIKNVMHGVQLGHPLHPVLTDIPIGAWTTALVLDAADGVSQDNGYGRGADMAIAVGLAGALGAAATGLTDWSEIDGEPKRIGLVHGLLNVAATALFATSYALRRGGSRPAGRAFALAGYGVALFSARLGGDLVFRHRIGVTHAVGEGPSDFADVMSSAELPEGTMRKVTMHDGANVLVVRRRQRLCAMAHECAHLGGPLSEGTLKENSVVCPWHQSEYSLDSGEVINGPSTHPQPMFDVREMNGRIQVRARAEQ